MTSESTFISLMRAMASDPAARGLLDDTAVISLGSENLILTHDMMAEGVHWLSNADPADVAWKLVASNLSDLAAKGARPLGVLLGFMLGDDAWDRAFASGLHSALTHFDVALLGGDTVANRGDKRALGLTAIGAATCTPVPARDGARAGDLLYVTGTLGDALAGFELIEAGFDEVGPLANAYNRPEPRLAEGRILAPLVHAAAAYALALDAEGRILVLNRQGLLRREDRQFVPLALPEGWTGPSLRFVAGNGHHPVWAANARRQVARLDHQTLEDLPPPAPPSSVSASGTSSWIPVAGRGFSLSTRCCD